MWNPWYVHFFLYALWISLKLLIFRFLGFFGSVSDNKWTVSGRIPGSLLTRLNRINITFMKNKKFIKNTHFFNYFFEIKMLKIFKIFKIPEILKFWNSTLLVLARPALKIFKIWIFQNFNFEKNKNTILFFIDFLISHKNDADTVQPT